MKKIFLILTILLSVFLIQACNESSTNTKENPEKEKSTKKKNAFSIAASEVLSSVITTFKGKYPNAANVNWEKATEDGKPSYKAKWQVDGKKIKAEFAEDGTFIKEKGSE